MTPSEFAYYLEVLVHRVLCQHRPYERCAECPPELPMKEQASD